MANPNIYNDALNKFRAEYNLPDYDLEKEIAADNVTRFFNNKSIGASAQQYERLAANAALKYFESSTNFQKTGTQKLKGFDHSKFINDFEALMQARYDSKLEDGAEAERRTPFDGSNKKTLKTVINASANKVNKPLAELWADKLKSGTLKFKDLNSIVATQSGILFTANEKTEEHVRIFRDLVASREAVRELRASRKGIRGFFWRLFNREQNKQEKDLLASLNLQINQLGELKGYDVNSALHDATNVTTWGKDLFERTYEQDLSIDKRPEEELPTKENEEQEKVQFSTFDQEQEPTVVNNDNTVNEEIVQQENLAISNDMNNDLIDDNVPNLSEEENEKQIEDDKDDHIEDEEENVEEEIEEAKTQTFADKFSSILNQPDFADTFAQTLAEKLPSGRTLKHEDRRVETYVGYILEVNGIDKLGKKIDGLNKKFDEGMAAGRDEDELMQEYMKGIIPEAYEIAGTFRYEVPYVNNLVITQLALDYMIQNYSPATQFESLQRYKQGILFEDKNLRHVASTRFTDERTEMAKQGYDKVKDVGVVQDEKESAINDMRESLDNDQLKIDVEGTNIETKSEKVEVHEAIVNENVKE